PLAVHPFGAFLVAVEAVVALWLWRGRSPQAALPTLAVALLAVPLLLADLRLSERYTPKGHIIDSGVSTGAATLQALGGAAGGSGAMLALFVGLAAVGMLTLARRRRAVAALALLTVAVPPP